MTEMTHPAALHRARTPLPTIDEDREGVGDAASPLQRRERETTDSGDAARPAHCQGGGLRARWARMLDTKKIIHPPALRFDGPWEEAAEAICHSWVDSQAMHDRSQVSHLALSKMKALEFERKHTEQIAPHQRLLPGTATRQDYYDAEIDAFLEAIGEVDTRAVLESFKLAGTGGLHRQHATLAATLTNTIGAAQLIVPDPATKAGLAGARMLLQGVTAGSVLHAGPRRLRNAGTEDILPLGRADAAPSAKIAPNVLQASTQVIHGLKGAEKNLQNMQSAMHELERLQAAAAPDAGAVREAKQQLELTFAKICHQLSLKSAYKASSESAKIEFWGNQRYLLVSYAGSSATLTTGLIAIMTPALIAAPVTGGLSAAAVAFAVALYVGYQLGTGPAKDGEAKAKRAIVALVKLVEVLSGERTTNLVQRAQAWQAYLDARREVRFASPARKAQAKRAAKTLLLERLEELTNEDRPEALLTAENNWTAYRAFLDQHEAIVAREAEGILNEAQCRRHITALKEQFGRDHHADFALREIVAAWKTPMLMRIVAAQRLLKGKVARSQKRLMHLQHQPSPKARWGTSTQKENSTHKIQLRKIELQQHLCDLFNLELARQDLTRPRGARPTDNDVARAAQRMAAIVDDDVRALFCGDGKAQVEAVNLSKKLTAGEAQRYIYANAGSSALGIAVNLGVTAADVVINNEKAAGTYRGPQYNDYKFLALSQGQAQPGAHLSVGDRAAFQKREMQPLLDRIDHDEEPREVHLHLGGDIHRSLRPEDSDVNAVMGELAERLAHAAAVPQTLHLTMGAQTPEAAVLSAAGVVAAAAAAADIAPPVSHSVVVELKSTSAFHDVQYKKNPLKNRMGYIAGQCAVGGRQALMSIAGLPTQALAQHRLKKTRAPLNVAAGSSHDVRAVLQSAALRLRAIVKETPAVDTQSRTAVAKPVLTPSDIKRNAKHAKVLWDRLQRAEAARWAGAKAPGFFASSAVRTNATGLRCRDTASVLKVQDRPIHGHRIGPAQASADAILANGPSIYAAGQSPDAASLDDFLLQGIESRQGIFQFVSRKAHHLPEQSSETPVIALLQTRCRDQPGALIGGRYRIDAFTPVEEKESDTPQDHLHFSLQVTDTLSNEHPPSVIRIPITQAGLKFTDRVLDTERIVRADALMDAHIDQLPDALETNASGGLGIDRMVLSQAGIGRNATLITYRTLRQRIIDPDHKRAIALATLDDALFDVIYAGRGDRDEDYIPSLAQLSELRKALLQLIVTQRTLATAAQ